MVSMDRISNPTLTNGSLNDFIEEGPQLIVLNGQSTGRRALLDKPVTSIGRGEDNDLVLKSDSVSRLHARIVFNDDRFVLEDLNSRHGVRVNDVPVAPDDPRRLSHGDIIRMPDHLILFCHVAPLSDSSGMSTIRIDPARVRREIDQLLEDFQVPSTPKTGKGRKPDEATT